MTCHDLYLDETIAAATAPAPFPRIIVGVDGSPGSAAALRWALQSAAVTGAGVVAVDVIQPLLPPAFIGGYLPATAVATSDLRAAAHATIDRVVRAVEGAAALQTAAVQHMVIENPSPARTLLRVAQGASMLVVGAHRHHGLGVLLGSTGSACIRHATCPIVVVPQDWFAPTAATGSRPATTTVGAGEP